MRRSRAPRGTKPYDALVLAGSVQVGDCLISQATPHSRGYRYVQLNRKTFFAHREAFLQHHGEIPEGFDVDHVCHNEAVARGECDGGNSCVHRACWNPAHLRATSRRDNLMDGIRLPMPKRWGTK